MIALNQCLYDALESRFGQVRITNPGEPAQVTHSVDWSTGSPKLSPKVEGGERYYANCPFCNDIRGRLSFSYLWGTTDERTGQRLMHLVCCHNEHCIDSRYQQELLRGILFPMGGQRRLRRTTQTVPASNVPVVPRPKISLPGGCVPLTDLRADHPAIRYLEGRGFDVAELSERWAPRYCELDNAAKPRLRQRIVIPIYDAVPKNADNRDGVPIWRAVGWQARTIHPESEHSPRYLTAAGLRKSQLLYGLPQVTDRPGPIVLVEGPTDVWRLGHDAVAIFGKTLSAVQRQRLLDLAARRSIVVALDPDAAKEAQRADAATCRSPANWRLRPGRRTVTSRRQRRLRLFAGGGVVGSQHHIGYRALQLRAAAADLERHGVCGGGRHPREADRRGIGANWR